MFDFLSIPESLQQTFKLPDGAEVSDSATELRKKKTIGVRSFFFVC